MKLVQINATCGQGSTGKICVSVSELLTEWGIENYIFYASGNSDYSLSRCYMHSREIKLQALKSRILGNYGFNSNSATRRLLKQLEEINPDVVHLHNLHGHNCNLDKLFSYFREKKIKVFWTFHDCWAFTGYCPYYTMIGCEKWKTGCKNCPQRRKYSWFFDRSHFLYEKKKAVLSDLDLTIITPSQWMADQVKQSFLNRYEIKVINNGIDLSVFSPRLSDFRKKYQCEDKFILLGVAFDWDPRKGLDVFQQLAERLDDRFQIVLVGTNDKIDQQLDRRIISIHRTQNQQELAEIYSAADLFLNPTREENYPTVNMEALACGTPVATFQTGGSPEMLDETCGVIIPVNDVEALHREIKRTAWQRPFSENACLARARAFDANNRFKEYVDLYGSINWNKKTDCDLYP